MAVKISYKLAGHCWDPYPLTEDQRSRIPPTWQQYFPSFIIGYKLSRLERNPGELVPIDEVINAYRDFHKGNRLREVLQFVNLASATPDPRLAARNFELSETLKRYRKTLPKHERSRFAAYIYGSKLQSLDSDEEDGRYEAEIEFWEKREKVIEDYITIGKHWYAQFRQKQPQVSEVLDSDDTSDAHLYDEYEDLPPATLGDLNEVKNAIGSHFNDPKNELRWVFHSTICQNGGVGDYRRIVHLFVSVDELDYIQERMIVKIQGGKTVEMLRSTMENEFDLHQRLTSKECRHIVDVYACSYRVRRTPPMLGYVYMDYAPFGDLHKLMEKHDARNENTVQIPESMLWHIFRGAAEALLLMQTGRTIDDSQPEEPDQVFEVVQEDSGPWVPIVNSDIKPMNIVLGDSVQDYYPAYKTPKMIDFGLAYDNNKYPNKRSKLNKDGTWKTARRGTPGWNPPEAFHRPWREYENEAIDGRTDIWQVGLVMLNLMESRPVRLDKNHKVGTDMGHSAGYKRTYSLALEDLVFECLAMDPKERPTIGNILYKTRIGRTRWENAYGNVNVPEADVPELFRMNWNENLIEEDLRWTPSKRRRTEESEESLGHHTSHETSSSEPTDISFVEEETESYSPEEETESYSPEE